MLIVTKYVLDESERLIFSVVLRVLKVAEYENKFYSKSDY